MINGKVLITGATGFIGGRIAERLWIDYGTKAHCLVHNFSNAARIARLPVKMFPGDLLDQNSVKNAIEGCEVIFHCAYGKTNDVELNNRINEEGTRNICEIALSAGVKKIVYISSVAVYGPNPPQNVNEETHIKFSDDEYGNSKIRAENICNEYINKELSIIIIRPTVVFGPFSPIWTIGAINRVLVGGWEYVNGIDGLCNVVYIDDLIDSLFLSAKIEKAMGEVFVISGEYPITWNEFYGVYIKLAGLAMPVEITRSKRQAKALLSKLFRNYVELLRKCFEPQIMNLYLSMKDNYPGVTKEIDVFLRGGIKDNEVDKFSLKTVYSIDKAKNMLGYSPRPFKEGVRITGDWLRHHEFI
ncbi:MAG TPA: NAD-dependent epimerase/dehydratase family protein [bacterium]|nr:NAD-dependent epimerase/dehydratase family protein [bacterium]